MNLIHKCRKLSDREGSFDVKAYPANNGSFTTCKKPSRAASSFYAAKRNKYAKIPAGGGHVEVSSCGVRGPFANDVYMLSRVTKKVDICSIM